MDLKKEIDKPSGAEDNSVSVDDFIKELEAKEKDLHITSDTTVIEMAEDFADELPDFMKGDFEFTPSAPPVAVAPPKAKPDRQASKLERQIADLKEKLSKAEADREEAFNAAQRRSRDFETFKTRTERERAETFSNQVGNLATQMLPALDNLDRAVDFALALPEETRTDIQQFLDGIVLVNQQVNEVLAEMGVQRIATVGELFDPQFHEAVATEESDEFAVNTISAELLRGYRMGDRVIRHSMVKVARGTNLPAVEKEGDSDVSTDSETPSSEE